MRIAHYESAQANYTNLRMATKKNMNEEYKPHWKIMDEGADTLTDPVEKAKWKDYAEKERLKYEKNLRAVFVSHTLTRVKDIFAVLLFLVSVVIVVILFFKSIFEGFISLVAAVFLLKYVFKKRGEDFFSWFRGWH